MSHKWVLANLKYQDTNIYAILFDESEGPFEDTPVHKKVGILRKKPWYS